MWPFKPKKQLFKVIFWMKSGSKVYVTCEKAKVTYEGELLTSWVIEGNQNGTLLFLPCDQIEAVTSEPIK
jgi:hypothetical protein